MNSVFNRATILPVVVFGLLLPTSLSAVNEVRAHCTANSERLGLELREEVAGFAEELERYVNETRWIGEAWEGTPITINFTVAFESGSEEGNYRASLAVVSQRDVYKSEEMTPTMRILDEDWTFNYVRNQQFSQNSVSYDPITSVVDFYVYIALGLDLDTYGYLGGDDLYSRALQISRRGELETSAGRADGWSRNEAAGAFSRQNLIQELTGPRFTPLRRFLLDYHYNGIDRLSEYPDAALDSLDNYLTDLMEIKNNLVASSTLIRVINDTKHQEFARIFTGYDDPKIWQKLLFIDPTHQSVYEEARRGG